MRIKELAEFIISREAVRIRKEAEKPRPWSHDKILNTYRFCNVQREDDRVTRWLRERYYVRWITITDNGQWVPDKDIWFAAVVARLLNLPDSLQVVADYVLPWKPDKFRKILHDRRWQGLKNFNAAYIVSTNGVAMDKVEYLVQRVLNPLWQARKQLRPTSSSLEGYHKKLTKFDGLGSFIAAQVIADLKYYEPLLSTGDWSTFAASGPGSRRGLNRVLGAAPNTARSETQWRLMLVALRKKLLPLLPHSLKKLHAQDVQNCLCEFDKYERARLGEGTPKQIYKEAK